MDTANGHHHIITTITPPPWLVPVSWALSVLIHSPLRQRILGGEVDDDILGSPPGEPAWGTELTMPLFQGTEKPIIHGPDVACVTETVPASRSVCSGIR